MFNPKKIKLNTEWLARAKEAREKADYRARGNHNASDHVRKIATTEYHRIEASIAGYFAALASLEQRAIQA